jgi:hypothetical protein
MLAMPLIGRAMLSAGGCPVVLGTSLRLPPIFPASPVACAVLRHPHEWFAMLPFLAHTAAAPYHGPIRHWRPGGVRRMLPQRATNEENADATPSRVAAVAVMDRLRARRVRGLAAACGQAGMRGLAARAVVRAERAAA